MPYLLLLKKRQHLKLSPAANYRWRFMGHPLNASYITKQQNMGNKNHLHQFCILKIQIFQCLQDKVAEKLTMEASNSTVVTSGQRPCHKSAKYVGTYNCR